MTKIMWCHENLQDLESVILGLPIACSIFEKSHFRSISFYQFMKTVAPKIGEILARAEQATKSRWQSFEEGILSSKFPHSRVQNLSQEQNFLHRVHVRIYFFISPKNRNSLFKYLNLHKRVKTIQFLGKTIVLYNCLLLLNGLFLLFQLKGQI